MGLIGQHELSQHMLIAGDGNGILVLHDRATVNVEGGDQYVLDMVFGGAARVLGAQLPLGIRVGNGILSLQGGQ